MTIRTLFSLSFSHSFVFLLFFSSLGSRIGSSRCPFPFESSCSTVSLRPHRFFSSFLLLSITVTYFLFVLFFFLFLLFLLLLHLLLLFLVLLYFLPVFAC